MVKPATLQWYGYAVDGVGFHCLEMDDALFNARVALPENAAMVIINEIDPRSKLSVQLLSDDLKKLVEEHWDWQVKRINDSDFSVIFPNAQSLKLCKNTGGLTLPVSKVSVLVVEPKVYQSSESSLAKVWVFLSDVPEVLRNEHMLMEATKMIGRPRLVDEASLAGPGPVRMLFHSQAPSRIPASILLFANDQGFRIGLASEVIRAKGSPPPPSLQRKNDDDEEEETEDQSRSDAHWKHRSSKPQSDKGVVEGSSAAPTADQARAGKQNADQAPKESIYTFKKGYYKVSARKLRSKPSQGSSSVPLPSAVETSVTKPALAPAKQLPKPMHFNQYGSNIPRERALDVSPGSKAAAAPAKASSPILLLEDDSPPRSPNVFKINKLNPADRADIGWESPLGWEFSNETLAVHLAKLKKKQ
jgi:hypothetical protein